MIYTFVLLGVFVPLWLFQHSVRGKGVVLLAEVLLDRKLPKKTENDRLDAVADATHLDTDGWATGFDDAENRAHRYGRVLRFRRTAG